MLALSTVLGTDFIAFYGVNNLSLHVHDFIGLVLADYFKYCC